MSFRCLENCGKCCGIIPLDRKLLDVHRERFQRRIKEQRELSTGEVLAITEDGYCVFLGEDKKCRIYEDRPALCRIFGLSVDQKFSCPYIKRSGRHRTEAGKKKILRYFNKAGGSRVVIR